MNTPEETKPMSTHTAERTLYRVQVKKRHKTSRVFLLNEKIIGDDWDTYYPPDRKYVFTEFDDTAAELGEGLFPYPLAMAEAYLILCTEHGRHFAVRLVPHLVKTSYASFPMEPMPELNRRPE